MTTFKEFLTEAVRMSDFIRTSALIKKYLKKNLRSRVYMYPVPEKFTPSGLKAGVGIKFFIFGDRSIRFNWLRTISDSLELNSLDYWDGTSKINPAGKSTPTTHIQFKQGVSLVRVLPFVVDFLNGTVDPKSTGYIAESTDSTLLNEGYTKEQIAHTIKNSVNAFKMGIGYSDQLDLSKQYGPKLYEVVKTIKALYPDAFFKEGKRTLVYKDKAANFDSDKILASMFTEQNGGIEYKISKGAVEVYDTPGATDQDIDRMNYEEQLESLKTGMKLLMSNATNAMFVGGRGGTGKTQTVEDMLHAAGKTDGEGYFKITGSATPAGIYRILYQNRNNIILFDDSDSALNDQDGRNLFKAASDTKKVRKISWMKGGKNYVDPADFDEEADDDTLPRYFEFTGKIIFISNLPLDKLDPDGALRTRGYVLNVDPTNEEIYDFMVKIVDKIKLEVDYVLDKNARLEVVNILRTRKIAEKKANLRSLVRALNTRAGIEQQGGSSTEWIKFVKLYA